MNENNEIRSPENLIEVNENSQTTNSSTNSSNRKKGGSIKIGTPEVIEIGDIRFLFDISGAKHKMDKLKAAKLCREQYLEQMVREGGDIHFFKCQTFGASYKRQTTQGILTPQGEFDLDPLKYVKDNLKSTEFEYLGIEEVKGRVGLKKTEHHKLLVKEPLLSKLVEELTKEDEFYRPVPGKVLSYTKFYAIVCKGSNTRKIAKEEQKKQYMVAKKNNFDQINAMEQQALLSTDQMAAPAMDDVKRRRSELLSLSESQKTVEDMQKYQAMQDTLDFELKELTTVLINKRAKVAEYYESVRKERQIIEVERAALHLEKNKRRRERRAQMKLTRQRTDNNLDKIQQDEEHDGELEDEVFSEEEEDIIDDTTTEI